MLTRLTVRHYKSLENVDLELGPLTVLVGRNGSGKSNIVDAIKFIRDSVRDGLDEAVTERHGFAALRQWSTQADGAHDVFVGVRYDGAVRGGRSSGRYGFSITDCDDGYRVQREVDAYSYSIGSKELFNVFSIRRGQRIAVWSPGKMKEKGDSYVASSELMIMLPRGETDLYRYNFTDAEVYSIFPNTLRDPQKISQPDQLSAHGDNLASLLRKMAAHRLTSPLREIEEIMSKMMPRLQKIVVESLGSYIVPRFLMREESGEEHYFDVNHLSDGTLRVLGILVALYQDPGPAVIALEEPELTVHPGALPLLADAMKEASKRRQVIVTTHSPDLLDQFDPDVIRVVEMDDRGVTTVSPLSPTQVNAVRDHLFTLGQLMSIEGLHS